jgi:hypothetical protein
MSSHDDIVSDGAQVRRAAQVPSLVFFTGFSLLVAHELDAVEQAEWRLLPLLNRMPDDTAYVVFVALHVPLIAGLMWLTTHVSPRIRQRSQLGVDAFLIIHAALHWFLSSDPLYTFHSSLSNALIFGGGLVGLVHLLLLVRSSRSSKKASMRPT